MNCYLTLDKHVTKRLGLLAGAGELPEHVAKSAIEQGFELFVYTIDRHTFSLLKPNASKYQLKMIKPGLLNQNLEMLHEDGIKQAVFAGKIDKWMLLKSPLLDSKALQLWQQQQQFNDDSIMLTLIRELDQEGITVVRQTDFLNELFIKTGIYTKRKPTQQEMKDVEYGMHLAKEIGRLDIGQTVIVSNQMILAVEAIEGTDQAILRAKKWGNKQGGVVAKVEKPNQDLRFDVPTVGPRTLKTMKKAGLNVLAVEAGKTLVLELKTMIKLANIWNMSLIAV